MRTKHIIPGLVMGALLLASCYRKQDVVDPTPNPVGGKGGVNGRTQLRITPKHFEQTVDTCWVYIKYDATSRPVNWKFDDSMEVKPQNGTYQAIFDSLKQGNYYFWARGYDFNLMDTITGGEVFKVPNIVDTTKTPYIHYDVFMDLRTVNGK